MKQSNLFPLVLLFGGLGFALYYSYVAMVDPTAEYALQFALASLVGVLGWRELGSCEEFNETFKSE